MLSQDQANYEQHVMNKKKSRTVPAEWLVIGAHVDYFSRITHEPSEIPTLFDLEVRAGPCQLPSGQWVIWLKGKSGCVSIDAVRKHEDTKNI